MKRRNGRRAVKKREKKSLERYEEFMKPFYLEWNKNINIEKRADYEPTLDILTVRDINL